MKANATRLCCGVLLIVLSWTHAHAQIRVLGIDTGSAWDYGTVASLSGVTFTEVSTTAFATVNLDNFDVLMVGETFLDISVTMPAQATLDSLIARQNDVAGWMAAGHGVVALAEPIGSGRFAWLPAVIRPTVGQSVHSDTTSIVRPSHPVMAGLTSSGLSGWFDSSHGNFTSTGGLDVIATEGGTRPITLAGSHGSGRIVITDQDPDFHLWHNPRSGKQYVQFVRNAIDWVAATGVLTGTGTARPGGRVALTVRAPRDAGLRYQLGSSLGTGPIPIGSRRLGLSLDNLLQVSVNGWWASIFSNYQGVIVASGQVSAAVNIPNFPLLIGNTIHTAFVTLSASAPQGIESISNTYSFTIVP